MSATATPMRPRRDVLAEIAALNDLERVTDRTAGRWCATCGQHGGHHTERHAEFAIFRDNLATQYQVALADDGRPITIDDRRDALQREYEDILEAEGRPIPNAHYGADEPRYDIDVDLTYTGASTGAVMNALSTALQAANVAPEEIDKMRLEMMSGSYDHALHVAYTWAYLRIEDLD